MSEEIRVRRAILAPLVQLVDREIQEGLGPLERQVRQVHLDRLAQQVRKAMPVRPAPRASKVSRAILVQQEQRALLVSRD